MHGRLDRHCSMLGRNHIRKIDGPLLRFACRTCKIWFLRKGLDRHCNRCGEELATNLVPKAKECQGCGKIILKEEGGRSGAWSWRSTRYCVPCSAQHSSFVHGVKGKEERKKLRICASCGILVKKLSPGKYCGPCSYDASLKYKREYKKKESV